MTSIGFIGLGNMGEPMVNNLLKAGHRVRGYDIAEAPLHRVSEAGAEAADGIADAARDVAVVITMLPAGQHVKSVYTEAGGVLEAAAAGTLLIDCSTIDVATAREVNRAAAAAGFEMLDAPVSGGVAGAAAATLTFMVGGSEAAFRQAQPILEVMGKNIVHTGAAGNGQAAKICNNLILGISMIAVSESFILAEKLGLERQKLFDVASKSSGQCWSLTTYCPVPGPVPTSPANRDYQPGFTAAMMLKDLKLSQEAAESAHAWTPLGAEATAVFERFVAGDGANSDFSGIINMLRSGGG